MDNAKSKAPLWSVSFVLVVLISLLGNMNGAGIQNAIMIIIDQEGGAVALGGTISAVFSFTALLVRFVAGSYSDRYGRKRIIILGAILLAAGYIINLISTSTWMFLPARFLQGAGFALASTAFGAAVADIVPPARLGEAAGYQGFANALSLALGPMVAVGLANSYGKTTTFATFLGLAILMLVLAAVCTFKSKSSDLAEAAAKKAREEAEAKKQAELEAGAQEGSAVKRFFTKFIEPKALIVSFVNVFYAFGLCLFMTFIALYATTYGLGYASLYFVISAAVMFIIRIFASKLCDKYPIGKIVAPCMVFGIAGLLLLAFVHTTWAMLTAAVLYGIANCLATPGLSAEAIRRAPANRRGAASSTYWISYDIGVGLSSIVWGFTIDLWGFTTTFILGACVLALVIVLALVFLGKRVEQQS